MLELQASHPCEPVLLLEAPNLAGPSFPCDDGCAGLQEQQPVDSLDEALMESFPCSDPPCYSHSHA